MSTAAGVRPARFSVVIPTYQRRDLVLASVAALARQECSEAFEAIVVVDGSRDGSAEALTALDVPFPFRVLTQPNRGAAAARNAGAAAATGDILLFLDDDMEAHPRLLAEHDRSHRDGVEVVFGHLPLHPQAPANFLSDGIRQWTDGRLERLAAPGAELTLHDLMTGQMSLPRALFNRLGGFDPGFTAGGTFGDEDIDFGYRLMRAGCRLAFNPHAISWQNYIVRPRQYLRQWRQAGQADVAFARKHPEVAHTIFELNGASKPANRRIWRPLAAAAPLSVPAMVLLRWLALLLVRVREQDARVVRFFYQIWAMEYWRGVAEAGGMPRPRPLRVLAYHAIQDLKGAPLVGPYSVPPRLFARQLALLRRLGFQFISPDEFVAFVAGRGGLPRRPVLLTFDDAYQDLLDAALPVLHRHRIPAVVFVVSGQVGGTNVWDEAVGAPRMPLLDRPGLEQLRAAGIEIGAHSRTHRTLTALSGAALSDEVRGSVQDLEALGLPRPRVFAYPEGEYDRHVHRAVREAGMQAAMAIWPGVASQGDDPFQVPRIEILATDGVVTFLWKVLTAGRAPRRERPTDAGPLPPR